MYVLPEKAWGGGVCGGHRGENGWELEKVDFSHRGEKMKAVQEGKEEQGDSQNPRGRRLRSATQRQDSRLRPAKHKHQPRSESQASCCLPLKTLTSAAWIPPHPSLSEIHNTGKVAFSIRSRFKPYQVHQGESVLDIIQKQLAMEPWPIAYKSTYISFYITQLLKYFAALLQFSLKKKNI